VRGCILLRSWQPPIQGPNQGHHLIRNRKGRFIYLLEAAETPDHAIADSRPRTNDKTMAITLIAAHGLEHLYAHSFPVLVTAIYADLGLVPFQAGVLSAVRQLTAGVTSIGSGFFVDIFRHRSGQVLAFSMATIGLGYFLVSISPSYLFILAALFIASAGSALWHPPALGLLSQRFPRRRGWYISLHRSTGNVGDLIGPLLAGLLLGGFSLRWILGGSAAVGSVSWRWIMGGGTPMLIVLAIIVLVLLWNVTGARSGPVAFRDELGAQLTSLRQAFRGTGMWSIFSVSAVRGMGDRSYIFFLPLYLREELDKSFFIIAVHVALVAAPGIVSGPILGALSDRVGRKLIIVLLMAVAIVLPITTVLGGAGLWMTLSVTLFGLFHSSVNSLTQAAAIDEAEGQGLDATFMGLMWGSNAFFGAGAAIAVGWLVGSYGWQAAFYCASVLFLLGTLAAMVMPSSRSRQPGRVGAVA